MHRIIFNIKKSIANIDKKESADEQEIDYIKLRKIS